MISGERAHQRWSRLPPRDARTSLGSPRKGTFATALPILRVTLGLDEPAAATDDERHLPVNNSQLHRPCDGLWGGLDGHRCTKSIVSHAASSPGS